MTIGESIVRVDAYSKVKGEAYYSGDLNFDDQLYIKILFAQHPHAIVHSIDTSDAEALDGVIAVLTAKDVPVNEYGMIYKDQPVLCGPGSSIPYADRVRTVGDQIAVVIAETEEIATQALGKIDVEYEVLEIVTDPREAIKPNALLIHPDRKDNIITHNKIRKGNIDEAFNSADVIIESVYQTPVQEHAYLQPEAGVAYFDEEERITVMVAGQWLYRLTIPQPQRQRLWMRLRQLRGETYVFPIEFPGRRSKESWQTV